jgi:ATP-dependent exoDNAse (exonuclease V) beta subunit
MADLFAVTLPPALASASSVPDAGARASALDIQHSWIVEAPAGSGKTGLLIQRFLKLLATESVTAPGQVLAITFTDKAAQELRERVQHQLEAALRQDLPSSPFEQQTRTLAEAVLVRDRLLGWQLLEDPRQLNLRTIDSVCAEIARALPVLSGGGRLKPVKDALSLYQAAARSTLLQLGGNNTALNDALRTVLLHRDGNLADYENLIAEMLEWRDQWGELIPLAQQELDDHYLDHVIRPRLEQAIERVICSALTRLSASIPTDALHDLAILAAELGYAPGYQNGDSPIAICAGLNHPPGTTAEHLPHWKALIHLLTTASNTWRKESGINKRTIQFDYNRKHPTHQQLASILQQLQQRPDLLEAFATIKSLPPATYPDDQWLVAKALFRLLRHSLAELKLLFAERGECDFSEIALLARQVLRRDGAAEGLSNALGMTLQHLLIDEMQDTSTGQYELIQLLSQGWDGQSQTVFLVGDPKQSIYLFRQARVERFLRTMQTGQLGDLTLGRLRLTANFRSQRNLVDQFNLDFARIFAAPTESEPSDDVPFVPASALRSPSPGSSVVWHTATVPSGLTSEATTLAVQQQRTADAQAIRQIVLDWRNRPLPPGRTKPWSIAVLVTNRSHLKPIVAAFQDASGGHPIPFNAVKIDRLGERPEVLDLVALTRALLHPADRVAWLAVLHAPWCGLSLADLHTLSGADDPHWKEYCVEDLILERAHLLSDDGCRLLERTWPVLEAAIPQRGRLPIAQWVERTWRSLGGDASLDPPATSNAIEYLRLLEQIESELPSGTLDVALLDRRLKELYANPTPRPGAVDLMTIHAAKGLEWDVVLVPALHSTPQQDRNRLLAWDEIDAPDGPAATIILAPIHGKGQASYQLNEWLRHLRKSRAAAERRRLFYVACTRAAEELHLFASPKLKKDGTFAPHSASLLEAAWPIAEPIFAHAATRPPATILAMPTRPEPGGLALAAAASPRHPILQRLPASFDPRARFSASPRLPAGDLNSSPHTTRFSRPEGSFAARSLGNAIHTFLELLADRLATGASSSALLAELPALRPRIRTILRGDGLPASDVDKLATSVHTALQSSLADPNGLWLLAAHPDAASEYALTTIQAAPTTVRLDRIFRAGPEPLAPGHDHLWIVDYKTSTHGRDGLEDFLATEQLKYAPQLNIYARTLAALDPTAKLRIALYYPLLSRLLWWKPTL